MPVLACPVIPSGTNRGCGWRSSAKNGHSRSDAYSATVQLGFLGWLVLLAGVVALLRATGRGRCGREVTAVMLLGCLPPILFDLQEYFHPEDLMPWDSHSADWLALGEATGPG
jgi:hypothetical protein